MVVSEERYQPCWNVSQAPQTMNGDWTYSSTLFETFVPLPSCLPPMRLVKGCLESAKLPPRRSQGRWSRSRGMREGV